MAGEASSHPRCTASCSSELLRLCRLLKWGRHPTHPPPVERGPRPLPRGDPPCRAHRVLPGGHPSSNFATREMLAATDARVAVRISFFEKKPSFLENLPNSYAFLIPLEALESQLQTLHLAANHTTTTVNTGGA